MGLVYRNGRPYLYRSVRRNGRVTSEYLAGGEDAFLIGTLERMEATSEPPTFKRSGASGSNSTTWSELDELAEQARDLARDALSAAGYHQHHRGEWRKCRGE